MKLKFSPCLEIFFKDLPFHQRIARVAEIGYRYFEFWSWWDKDPGEIAEAAGSNNIRVLAFCTRFVSLVDPGTRNEYLDGLAETVEVAGKLGSKIIISQVGNELEGVSREEQKANLILGLRDAAGILEGTQLILAIEPLNVLYDHPGYFLSESAEAYEIVQAVNSPHVRILFDIYHQQVTEGNLINNIRKYSQQIAHFHVADHPGRHEPGTGEINYDNVFEVLSELEYEGGVGIELWPGQETDEQVLKTIISQFK